ncbi:MAG: FHA domain-containing protein [Acidobacteriota bacterium]
MHRPAHKPPASDSIRLCYSAAGRARSFSSFEPVLIGRDPSCDLCIDDPRVQPLHAEVYRVFDLWWVRDLGSEDGTFLDEECIDVAPLIGPAVLQLGLDGPAVWLEPRAKQQPQDGNARLKTGRAERAA